MNTTKKRPAYSYLRFSSLEQKKGDSQRRQSDQPESICEQHGWQLQDRTFQDCGVSAFRGRNRKKGDLSVFLAALSAGKLEPEPVLILEDLDRLSRDKIMPSIDTARQILECGCDVYSVLERKLYTRECLNDPMGLMGLIWRFYLAHEESSKKAERSRQNWSEKHKQAATGKVVTRICPAWLRVVDYELVNGRLVGGQFEKIPERVGVVKKIFTMCIQGFGTQQIVRKLMEENVPPFKSGWSQKTVWQILTDRRVLGDLPTGVYGDGVKRGEPITGYYPQVVTEKMFIDAGDAMRERKGKTGRRGDFLNLFTGLVHYPDHASTMVLLTKPRKGRMYRYLASYQSWKGKFPYTAVRYERFEHVVLSWLYDLKTSDLLPAEDDEDTVETLKARRTQLESRIKEIADKLEDCDTEVGVVLNKLAEMNVRKTKLTQEIEDRQRKQNRPALDDTKNLIDVMKGKTGVELRELREQIRQRLLLHISRIDVSVREGRAYLTVQLANKRERRVYFSLVGEEQGLWSPGGTFLMADILHQNIQIAEASGDTEWAATFRTMQDAGFE